MTGGLRLVLAAAMAWLLRWTATVLPLVHAGPVAVPGFAATADLALLAVLAAVVWFMPAGPPGGLSAPASRGPRSEVPDEDPPARHRGRVPGGRRAARPGAHRRVGQ